jgi:hypothetical protein
MRQQLRAGPRSKGLHIRFNHPIEGALMMTMLDEYVRWAFKPPFGGHYGGLFAPPHGRHYTTLPSLQVKSM